MSFGLGRRGGRVAEKAGSSIHHFCICFWQSKKLKFFYIECIWLIEKIVYLSQAGKWCPRDQHYEIELSVMIEIFILHHPVW